MSKRFCTFLLVLIIIPMVFSVGCNNKGNNNINSSPNNKIAYISSNADSEYRNTFKKLNLGILFDFNLKLPKADKSWVNIWVEGYSNGKAVEPFPLTKLSYGLSPVQVEEGQMGFGIINPNSNEPQFLLYSPYATHSINNNFFSNSAIASCWDYAIGSEPIGLESGEEVVLAVYRQVDGPVRTGYDYQDLNTINEMINTDITILILKIKVEERERL